jgi:hypothetical protein
MQQKNKDKGGGEYQRRIRAWPLRMAVPVGPVLFLSQNSPRGE